MTLPVAEPRPSYTVSAEADTSHSVPTSRMFTNKSFVRRPVGEHAVLRTADVRVQGSHAPDEDCHLRSG